MSSRRSSSSILANMQDLGGGLYDPDWTPFEGCWKEEFANGEMVLWIPEDWEWTRAFGWGQWWRRWRWYIRHGLRPKWMPLREGDGDGYKVLNGIYHDDKRFVPFGSEPWVMPWLMKGSGKNK